MNNCPNCGNQLQPGMNNCPYCGTAVNNGNQQGTMPNQNVGMQPGFYQTNGVSGNPAIASRNVVLAIVLSFVTCGIYGLYWFICLTDESNNLVVNNKTASGGMAILFSLLTCGIYQFYWYYKMGKKMHEAGVRYGKDIADNSVLYLILGFLGLGVVDYILIQNDLNKFATQ